MTTPLHAMVTGTFTSTGAAFNLQLPSGYQDFRLINITDIGSTAASTPVMRAEGTSAMLAGSAYLSTKTNGAATLDLETTVLVDGFTLIEDSALVPIGAAIAITAITAANPAVVSTATTTGLTDAVTVVRIINETNMKQISSMDFTVGTVVASTSFQLKYLDASGFAAAGTTGFYRIVKAVDRYYPRRRFITAITKAASAVITLSVTHGYTAGQAVRIYVPAGFGMTEINGLLGNITAINTTTNTITVDIDSTSFTTFAYPTSAIAAGGVSFPIVVPVGETAINSTTFPYGNLLDDATDNQSFRGITIGTAVQTTGKVYQYFATRGVAV